MRIVVDTNVFVSGVFYGGPPHEILEAWRENTVQLVMSPEIFDEYQRVGYLLAEEFPGVDLGPILELLLVTRNSLLPRPCLDLSVAIQTTTNSWPARWLVGAR